MKVDPIPRIRQDLAQVMIIIKPYYDRSEEEAYIITELLHLLIQDKNHDVAETAEHAELQIL
jgi:hypothetical protein